MGEVLDGGICLVRVPKGILGEETARLLGSFVVAKVWQTATHRARLGQAARVDAAFTSTSARTSCNLPRSFDEMLAEARGYGLSVVLAHQHLAQLPRDLREAVSANARTKVFFSMSPEDARALSRHVAPELSEHDLSHSGAFQAAARLVVGRRGDPGLHPAHPAAPPAERRSAGGRADGRTRQATESAVERPRRGWSSGRLPKRGWRARDVTRLRVGPLRCTAAARGVEQTLMDVSGIASGLVAGSFQGSCDDTIPSSAARSRSGRRMRIVSRADLGGMREVKSR